MKITTLLLILMTCLFMGQQAKAQNQKFKMVGKKSATVEVNQLFTESVEINPFKKHSTKVYGFDITADITLKSEESTVKIILLDKSFVKHLVYEANTLLNETGTFSVSETCEETAILEGIKMHALIIELEEAELFVKNFSFASKLDVKLNLATTKKELQKSQHTEKINAINKSLKAKGKSWVAGETSVAQLTYDERAKLYGSGTFPPGFEYYTGGVISAGIPEKSVSSSLYVGEWDWRNRHGKNWVTPVTDQKSCGSCWSFAATGATEALVNLYFNQQLNLDLSEQDLLSCSGAGSCDGGIPGVALDYINRTGIVDEGAFPYSATNETCESKSANPSQHIKIGGSIDLGSHLFPQTEDGIKKMIIEYGPLSGGLLDWRHAMTLVGYKVVKEGDVFYYRDLNLSRYWETVAAGDPLIGKTVWIFKNSWGPYFGDEGYIYVETSITNFGWTHALQAPIESEVQKYDVVCEDKDGDGYYWWGLGEKPATCTGPDQPDGDDSNPELGPLDEYGNCTSIIASPIADFSVDNNAIFEGEDVNFTDKSSNNPTSWFWEFEGGEPATSNIKNPKVKYNNANSYKVKLTVQSGIGSDTKIIEDCIQVKEILTGYCRPEISSSSEWISSVQSGEVVQNSGAAGYEDFTSTVFELKSGVGNTLVLTPGYTKRKVAEYWAVWIDFNGDSDFSDAGELVFSANRKRAAVSANIQIPAGVNIETRMRVAMSNSAPSACGNITSGEVEDYTVNIVEQEEITIYSDYCQPYGINSSSDYIQNVNISNVFSNNTGGDGYSLYETPHAVTAGANYAVSLIPVVYKNRNFWRIWMDFNGDDDFDDADETVLSVKGNRGQVNAGITIPDYAAGTVRMRIAMKTGKAPSPCEDNYNGEVEDYILNIDAPTLFKSAFVGEKQEIGFESQISIYPNPVVGKLNIKLVEFGVNDAYKIYNINGQVMVENQINSPEIKIDCSDYSPGIYILMLNNNGINYKEKIVKK